MVPVQSPQIANVIVRVGLDSDPGVLEDHPRHRVGGGLPLVPQPTMAEPASQPTTQVLECIECCRQWDVPSERWRVYVTEEEPREAVAYCPDCGEREFG